MLPACNSSFPLDVTEPLVIISPLEKICNFISGDVSFDNLSLVSVNVPSILDLISNATSVSLSPSCAIKKLAGALILFLC